MSAEAEAAEPEAAAESPVEAAERIRAQAEADAREMANAEITLEMEEANEGTFEDRCAQHEIDPASPVGKMLRVEYVQEGMCRKRRGG